MVGAVATESVWRVYVSRVRLFVRDESRRKERAGRD